MKRVFVVGGVSYNAVVTLPELALPPGGNVYPQRYYEGVGSTGAGKALTLARLGHEVTLHAMLGDDIEGQLVRQLLAAEEGLRLIADVDPAGTEKHINLMGPGGRRVSIFARSATFEPPLDVTCLTDELSHCDVVALNIINYARRLIPAVKQVGVPCWVDIHDYDGQTPYHAEFIDAADVLFFSSEALPDWSSFMAAQIAAGKQYVICTHGEDGATGLSAAGEWVDVPALPIAEVVDTNGAGDAFFSGVLAGFHAGLGFAEALHKGAEVAARCVGVQGISVPRPD